MIITKLIGGLGNQMFQYAAGRQAAYKNNTKLKLDISWFKNLEGAIKRKYLLDVFNIKEIFATNQEIDRLKGEKQSLLVLVYKKITKPYYKQSYLVEKYFHFDLNILKISDNTFLDGFWQSEKYFEDIKDIIKREFTFKKGSDRENKKIIYRITNSNSISIHIRRGDYVNDLKTKEHHGVCSLNYYKKAINIMLKKISNPNFFVFSDDPSWVKQNLILKYPCDYINHNVGKKDCEDLRLMSLCKHNIIANSTFSWWGAWLNSNPQKIVIAPERWFADKSLSDRDLIPASWKRI